MALLKQTWQSEPDKPKYQVSILDTGEHKVTVTHVVHTIIVTDSYDPEIAVAQPIYDWQQTDSGKWVMKNSVPVASYHRHTDYSKFGYVYQIRAYLTPEQITFFELKFK